MNHNTMTNAKLLRYHNEITAMQGSIHEEWNKDRINGFYRMHKPRLTLLIKRLEELSAKYFQFKDGKLQCDEKGEPLPIEGANIKEYEAKFNAIMSEENNVIMKPV